MNKANSEKVVFNRNKMTENRVIDCLVNWLEKEGWKDILVAKGRTHGPDIQARKGKKLLIVEAKGSKGNPESPVTKRKEFNRSQIKTHFGVAIVKLLEIRHDNPNVMLGIAQPNDPYMKLCLKNVLPEVKKWSIKLYWIDRSGEINRK